MSPQYDTVIAYTYRAGLHHPACLIAALITEGRAGPAARDLDPEDALDQVAGAEGIDRYNEWTFDSGTFPKVVFPGMTEDDEHCDTCLKEIHPKPPRSLTP